jgi:IS1 family transposase
MNRLPLTKRTQILTLLCEGTSMRAAARIADVSLNAVMRLLVSAGEACSEYQDKTLRNLTCKRLQLDEIWAFVFAKERNASQAMRDAGKAGDIWTWTAIDADTKLIASWMVGDRSGETARIFVCDLARRLANRVQVTTDGHRAYLEAVEAGFGATVDYAQLVKVYGQTAEGQRRYSPPEVIGTETVCCTGNPDPKHISTSFVERSNLTMRMHMRRFTRLTNGFSKKVENHVHAVALHTMFYNFCRIHKTLRVTPAMAAGVSNKLWTVEDIVGLIAEREAVEDGSLLVG